MPDAPVRNILWTIVILCFSSAYVVSVEDDEVSVTVANGTPRYIHIAINDESFLYVPPGGSARTSTMLMTAYVEAFYSPGQGVTGRAAKELTSIRTVNYRGSGSNTCSNDSQGCEINDSNSGVTSVSRTPMSWIVTPEDLAADTTSIE